MQAEWDTQPLEFRQEEENGREVISGFWRRLLAFAIDALVLGLVGTFLGFLFYDEFARLGGWGRLVGFAIALCYFGVLNSTLGKGQTVGKRLVKIRVADRSGKDISLSCSAIRYSLLAVPFFLNGAPVSPSVMMSPIGAVLIGFLIFGMGGAIVYLYVFNRRTRQSFHDLIAGTFVVRSSAREAVSFPRLWKGHLAVVGLWFAAVIVFIMFVVPRFARTEQFSHLLEIQKSIHDSGFVHYATVFDVKQQGYPGITKRPVRYLKVEAMYIAEPEDYKKAAGEIASIVAELNLQVKDWDFLLVKVTHGYDIGISYVTKGYSATFRIGAGGIEPGSTGQIPL